MENEITESYITMPAGFKAAGVACGLKTDPGNSGPMDLLDLNMIESDVPATVAGVYTRNLIKGHSLQRTIRVIDSGAKIRALVVNSKNANACVGPKGYQDAHHRYPSQYGKGNFRDAHSRLFPFNRRRVSSQSREGHDDY